MKTFAVWYMKPEFFRDGIMGVEWLTKQGLMPIATKLDLSHVFLRYVEAESMEKVFGMMQGEVWSPNGEARSRIEALGLSHTSMSVGDVVADVATGKAWIVDRFGFVAV